MYTQTSNMIRASALWYVLEAVACAAAVMSYAGIARAADGGTALTDGAGTFVGGTLAVGAASVASNQSGVVASAAAVGGADAMLWLYWAAIIVLVVFAIGYSYVRYYQDTRKPQNISREGRIDSMLNQATHTAM